jgi:serine phosphatase RsbU (regulator of sigma subunit)
MAVNVCCCSGGWRAGARASRSAQPDLALGLKVGGPLARRVGEAPTRAARPQGAPNGRALGQRGLRLRAGPGAHRQSDSTSGERRSAALVVLSVLDSSAPQPDVGRDNAALIADSTGVDSFARAYEAALREYVGHSGDFGLTPAYEVGRRAVSERLSILDLAGIHGDALAAALQASDSEDSERIARRSADFLRESLSTFEIALRGYTEMQEIARVEHDHAVQLQAIADAAVALKASGTSADILRVAAERTRRVLKARAASASLTEPGLERPSEIVAGESSLARAWPPSLSADLPGLDGKVRGHLRVWEPAASGTAPAWKAVLAQFAQLTSSALASAEALRTQRHIASILQRSLLPSALPKVEHVELGASFYPAGEGIVVGGDFYDAFVLDAGGAGGLVIGDVCGKGPAAAAITALVRHTLRAALLVEPVPVEVLRLVNAALRQQGGTELCTVLFGVLDPRSDGCSVRFATGGHPLPIVVPAAGKVGTVGEAGMMLGISDDARLSSFELSLGPGDLAVLYTDGVIEVRRGGRELFGFKGLLGVLEGCRGMRAQEVAARVADAALSASGGAARDDIAVLVVRADS